MRNFRTLAPGHGTRPVVHTLERTVECAMRFIFRTLILVDLCGAALAAFASGLWLATGVQIAWIEPLLVAWLFPLLFAAIATASIDVRIRRFLERPPSWVVLISMLLGWYMMAIAMYSLFVIGQLNNPGLTLSGLAAFYAYPSMVFWAELLLSCEVGRERF